MENTAWELGNARRLFPQLPAHKGGSVPKAAGPGNAATPTAESGPCSWDTPVTSPSGRPAQHNQGRDGAPLTTPHTHPRASGGKGRAGWARCPRHGSWGHGLRPARAHGGPCHVPAAAPATPHAQAAAPRAGRRPARERGSDLAVTPRPAPGGRGLDVVSSDTALASNLSYVLIF